jgi:hypothetical protein
VSSYSLCWSCAIKSGAGLPAIHADEHLIEADPDKVAQTCGKLAIRLAEVSVSSENAKTPRRFLVSGSLFIQMVGEIHDRMSRDAVASSRLVRAGSRQVTGWSNPVILNQMFLSRGQETQSWDRSGGLRPDDQESLERR